MAHMCVYSHPEHWSKIYQDQIRAFKRVQFSFFQDPKSVTWCTGTQTQVRLEVLKVQTKHVAAKKLASFKQTNKKHRKLSAVGVAAARSSEVRVAIPSLRHWQVPPLLPWFEVFWHLLTGMVL